MNNIDTAPLVEVPLSGKPLRIARLRLQSIEEQILRMEQGGPQEIGCPYCGQLNPKGIEPLCCDLFTKALAVVVHRMMEERNLEHFQKIAERSQRN